MAEMCSTNHVVNDALLTAMIKACDQMYGKAW